MIPKRVTWIRFPAKISVVYSKLIAINDLLFQFSIKHLHIWICYKLSYRISDQEIYSGILYKFCIFSPFFLLC